jgi:outer membrane lipoprotein-sorting protein
MNWMNLTDKWLRLPTLVLLFLGISSTLYAQESPFNQLKQKFEEGQIFKAEFHHQMYDSYTKDTMASRGEIWIGGERYKVKTKHQLVVVNGETSMVYDDSRNRVIISKYVPEEDDFAPSRILNGLDSTFTVEAQERRNDQIYIRLESDDPFAIYKKVEIFLSPNLVPKKIRAVDPVDNVITTTFNEGKFIFPGEQMFALNYPDGAEIIDMRN